MEPGVEFICFPRPLRCSDGRCLEVSLRRQIGVGVGGTVGWGGG